MSRAVSNRDICYIKAVILLREHTHFSLTFTSHSSNPAYMIRVKLGMDRISDVLISGIRPAGLWIQYSTRYSVSDYIQPDDGRISGSINTVYLNGYHIFLYHYLRLYLLKLKLKNGQKKSIYRLTLADILILSSRFYFGIFLKKLIAYFLLVLLEQSPKPNSFLYWVPKKCLKRM